jgi:hypothetical protein
MEKEGKEIKVRNAQRKGWRGVRDEDKKDIVFR